MNMTESIMSRDVVTVEINDSIINAYLIMKEKDIRHLPVVDADKKIVGMLSDRDIQRAMVAKQEDIVKIPSALKVSSFMRSPVYTVNEKTNVKAVVEIMIREKISSLVVDDGHGGIEGIVTTTDMLAYILQNLKDKRS